MLLTIRYEGENSNVFSYLLHKQPERVQTFSLPFGKAHLFYTENLEEKSTIALLLDVDSNDLMSKKMLDKRDPYMDPYINDRPYVASSLLSAAMAKVFCSALGGNDKVYPELVNQKHSFTVSVSVIRSRGGEQNIRQIFEPLGYEVEIKGQLLDDQFPEWGESPYYHLVLRGSVRLKDLLTQLYICLPALDRWKHYFVSENELQKLLQKGGDWLPTHPMRDFIIKGYLSHQKNLAKKAIHLLKDGSRIIPNPKQKKIETKFSVTKPKISNKYTEIKIKSVIKKIKELGVTKIIDLGCGNGKLIKQLVKNQKLTVIKGMDHSNRSLKEARDRLNLPAQKQVRLFLGSLLYQDPRTKGMDLAILLEIMDHVDEESLPFLETNLFAYMGVEYLIITVRNAEYNGLGNEVDQGTARYSQIQIKWTRKELEAWVEGIKSRYPYQAEIIPIGKEHSEIGSPIQMVVFKRINKDVIKQELTYPLSMNHLSSRLANRYMQNIFIPTKQAAKALETISRSAINPKWLIYLPPILSPSEPSKMDSYLEHPSKVFTYYRQEGVEEVICQVKHMGSRALVIICKDDQVAVDRFGLTKPAAGVVYTRTGRKFFRESTWENAFLLRIRKSLEQADFWRRFQTDWVLLDGELLPWSVKSKEYLKWEYASTGVASVQSLTKGVEALQMALLRGLPVQKLYQNWQERQECSQKFIDAYRKYCWRVEKLDDLQFAPFHLLATEGKAHVDQDHLWHMTQLSTICQYDPKFLITTNYKVVQVKDPISVAKGIAWWEELTKQGSEGIIIKPLDFIAQNEKGLIQSALGVGGMEYLRIIYGAHYQSPNLLKSLRKRNIKCNQKIALQEFSLSLEALYRFVEKEPLQRVHECVFGILSLESEPINSYF